MTQRALLAALVTMLLSACVSTLSRTDLASEYYNLGNAYYDLERYDESAAFLSRAVQLDASLARASYNLARAYLELGRYSEAEELLDQLLATDPGNVVLLETAGYAAYLQSNVERAAAFYDLALEQSPADPELLRNRATVAIVNEDLGQAAQLLERSIALTADPSDLMLELTGVYEQAGDVPAAVRTLRAYLADSADDDTARLWLAELLVDGAFFANALDELDALSSENGEAAFLRARVLLTAADDEAAGLEALARAFELGFSNEAAVTALLENPDLTAREQVDALVRETGIVDDEAEESSGTSEQADSDAE